MDSRGLENGPDKAAKEKQSMMTSAVHLMALPYQESCVMAPGGLGFRV